MLFDNISPRNDLNELLLRRSAAENEIIRRHRANAQEFFIIRPALVTYRRAEDHSYGRSKKPVAGTNRVNDLATRYIQTKAALGPDHRKKCRRTGSLLNSYTLTSRLRLSKPHFAR